MYKKIIIFLIAIILLAACGRITSSERDSDSAEESPLSSKNTPTIKMISFFPNNVVAPYDISFLAQVESVEPSSNLVYLWSFGDGATSNARTPVHKYTYRGEFYVSLLLTGSDGSYDFKNCETTVKLLSGNRRPVINSCTADRITANINEQINFYSVYSDPDGDAVSCVWDFGDGDSSTDQNPQHSYAQNGVYHVKLTVTDAVGASISKQILIGIGAAINLPPVIESIQWDPYSPWENSSVSFSATAVDYDGTIILYSWDFGDGQTSTISNPAHTYTKSGAYQVILTVQDDSGLTAEKAEYISVGIGE